MMSVILSLLRCAVRFSLHATPLFHRHRYSSGLNGVMCLVPAHLHAASFDCASVETAVLDDALAAVNAQALATSGSPHAIESQQKKWLAATAVRSRKGEDPTGINSEAI
ncbi:MAG: hypothetical protein ACRED0_10840 [Gammaproteobacteria bacterium]